MIPRAAAEIFSHIEGDTAHEYTVYMSYVQLYMELIQVRTCGWHKGHAGCRQAGGMLIRHQERGIG